MTTVDADIRGAVLEALHGRETNAQVVVDDQDAPRSGLVGVCVEDRPLGVVAVRDTTDSGRRTRMAWPFGLAMRIKCVGYAPKAHLMAHLGAPACLKVSRGGRDVLPGTTDTFVGGCRSRSNRTHGRSFRT